MTRVDRLKSWLTSPPITGRWVPLFGIAAVAVPTVLRASIDGIVTGLPITPYVPFVVLAAILLPWAHAAFVAVASAMTADALFIGPPPALFEGPTDFIAVGTFLVASAVIIGFVVAVRSALRDELVQGPHQPRGSGIIFSLEDGEAWASWSGQSSHVHLGPQSEVAEMMKDFLAQLEVGRRLTERSS